MSSQKMEYDFLCWSYSDPVVIETTDKKTPWP
jgi:hypothetical protein